MDNPIVSNPNDHKVVSFHNSTVFDFTPEMGCMYDGRAINSATGAPGIQAGETKMLPYHVGNRLAINLAKRVLNTSPAATVDKAGIPTGEPIWSEARLNELAATYIKELYTEERPIAQSQTDLLMAKVEALSKMVETLSGKEVKAEVPPQPPIDNAHVVEGAEKFPEPVKVENPQPAVPKVYMDKQEVIAELEKRQITHDKRKSKADLEKLLV